MPFIVLIIVSIVSAPLTINKMEKYNQDHQKEIQAQSLHEIEQKINKEYGIHTIGELK